MTKLEDLEHYIGDEREKIFPKLHLRTYNALQFNNMRIQRPTGDILASSWEIINCKLMRNTY